MKHYIKATIFNRKGHVIAVGKNSYSKTHPMQAEYAIKNGLPSKVFLHAEIAALVKCRETPYRIKIERYDKKGNPKLAKPCPICEMAILESGIKIVEHTIG